MLSLYSSLPFLAQEILMMSHSGVMIVCSIFLVGKPLHMHNQTSIVHLHICQHPHQNPLLLQKLQTSLSLFNPFSMPVTYIQTHVEITYIWLGFKGHNTENSNYEKLARQNSLQFIDILTQAGQESCNTVNVLFDTINKNSMHNIMKW